MLTSKQVKRMYDLGLLWSKETSFDFDLKIEEMNIVADKCRMFILQKVMRECGYAGNFPDMPYNVNWFLGYEDIFFFVDFGDFDGTAEQFSEMLETGEQHYFRLWNGWAGDECVGDMAHVQDVLAEASAKFMGAKDLFLCSMENKDCKNIKEIDVLKHAAELMADAEHYYVSISSMGGMFMPTKGYELPFVPDNPEQNPHTNSVLTYTPEGVRFLYSLGGNSPCDGDICMSLITDVVKKEEWHVAYSALTELWCVYAMTKGGLG